MYYIHYNPILHSRLQCKQKSRQCCRLTKAHRVSVVLFWDYLFIYFIFICQNNILQTSVDFSATDVKRFEAILGSQQPDLLSYCTALTSTRDCLQAIRSIRDCKHHIQLAEALIANRYATLLAERSKDSDHAGGKLTSSGVVAVGSVSRPQHLSDASTSPPLSSVCLSSFCTRLRIRIVILYVYVLKKPSNVLSVLVQMVCVHGSSYISQISRNKNFTMQTINCCPKHCVADAVAPPSLRQQYIDN